MVATAPPANTFPQIQIRAPLVSLDVVRAALRMNTAEVLRLVECGALPWAFDFALHQDGRREARVLARCLADYQRAQRPLTGGNEEFSSVWRTIFPMAPSPRPGVVATLKADTIARQFGVKTAHCLALADCGRIRLAPGGIRHAGPGGSPAVELPSVASFLQSRRIT